MDDIISHNKRTSWFRHNNACHWAAPTWMTTVTQLTRRRCRCVLTSSVKLLNETKNPQHLSCGRSTPASRGGKLIPIWKRLVPNNILARCRSTISRVTGFVSPYTMGATMARSIFLKSSQYTPLRSKSKSGVWGVFLKFNLFCASFCNAVWNIV